MEIRDNRNNVVMRIVEDKCYDVNGNLTHIKIANDICDMSGNTLFTIQGNKVLDTNGKWVYGVFGGNFQSRPVGGPVTKPVVVTCAFCGRAATDAVNNMCAGCGAIVPGAAVPDGSGAHARNTAQPNEFMAAGSTHMNQNAHNPQGMPAPHWRSSGPAVPRRSKAPFVVAGIFIFLIIVGIVSSTGGGGSDAATVIAPVGVVTENAGTPPAVPAAQASASAGLVGTWLWRGSPYYVFRPDGTGTMSGNAINWWADDGVLSICSTPASCGDSCRLPTTWDYVIDEDGDRLTLTGRRLGLMSFEYTRQPGSEAAVDIEVEEAYTEEDDEADAEDTEEADAEEADTEDTEEADASVYEPVASDLVGTWLWMNTPYYVFEPDGTGTMAGMDINWTTNDGILYVCTTPAQCRGNCSLPQIWDYVLDGDRLTLTSRQVESMTFDYIRQ